MKEKVYLISNIEEFGKFVAFCIDNDISVFRTYWNEDEKNDRCYSIDWNSRNCYYATKEFYESNGYVIVTPNFYINDCGRYEIAVADEETELYESLIKDGYSEKEALNKVIDVYRKDKCDDSYHMNDEERKQFAYLVGMVLKLAYGETLNRDEISSLDNIAREFGFDEIPEDEFLY